MSGAAGDTPAQRLAFDGFVLDLPRGCLTHDGREIALRPKTFAVLTHLVQHAGTLVSKDELLAAVWPNLVVTDDTVVQSIGDVEIAAGSTLGLDVPADVTSEISGDLTGAGTFVASSGSLALSGAVEPGTMVVRNIGTVRLRSMWRSLSPSSSSAHSNENEQPSTKLTRSSRHTSSSVAGSSMQTPSRNTR